VKQVLLSKADDNAGASNADRGSPGGALEKGGKLKGVWLTILYLRSSCICVRKTLRKTLNKANLVFAIVKR